MSRTQFSLPILLLALLCAVSFSLMLWASFGDSAIMDELAHIPAGYGYIHNLDYRLNPEHPPLVKALAMLPVLFLNPKFPTGDSSWTTDVNGQWAMGEKFLYESGNDPNLIVRVARIMPMLLTILLIILIYVWSAELLGTWWALVPAFLFGLSPTVLAHGHYVTTDVGAVFGVVLATWSFITFLFSPSRTHLIRAGIAFGIAELAKFSMVLLIPYFLILIVFFFASTVCRDWNGTEPALRFKRFSVRAWRYLRSVILIFAIGYVLIVYPVYFLFTINYPVEKQMSDTRFTLTSFAEGPTPPGHFCKPVRCLADLDIGMAKNPVTRPFAEYFLGVLMVTQRASGGNTSYFLGEVSNTGSRFYFPVVYLLKEPLPVLLFVLVAFLLGILALFKRVKGPAFAKASAGRQGSRLRQGFGGQAKVIRYFFTDYLGVNFAEFSLLVFILFYWAYSMKSPLNIGVRHLLPTIPFIYILSAGVWKRWLTELSSLRGSPATADDRGNLTRSVIPSGARDLIQNGLLRSAPTPMHRCGGSLAMTRTMVPKLRARYTLLILLLIWGGVETAFAAPYFLSYFNELGGGVLGGYRFVTAAVGNVAQLQTGMHVEQLSGKLGGAAYRRGAESHRFLFRQRDELLDRRCRRRRTHQHQVADTRSDLRHRQQVFPDVVRQLLVDERIEQHAG